MRKFKLQKPSVVLAGFAAVALGLLSPVAQARGPQTWDLVADAPANHVMTPLANPIVSTGPSGKASTVQSARPASAAVASDSTSPATANEGRWESLLPFLPDTRQPVTEPVLETASLLPRGDLLEGSTTMPSPLLSPSDSADFVPGEMLAVVPIPSQFIAGASIVGLMMLAIAMRRS